MRQGLPAMEGLLETNVMEEVEVRRDSLGIPHIKAKSMEDLLFAQGYMQAMDRLWQMDLNRRAMAGRLSEIFGEDFIGIDIFLRSLLMHYTAKNAVSKMDPAMKDLLMHFVAGVNAYLEENSNTLSPEFLLLGYRPDPWKLEDTLGIGKYMAWELGGNMTTEIFLWAALKELPEELVLELFPTYPLDGATIIPQGMEIVREGAEDLLSLLNTISLASPGALGQDLGSNNWVVGGAMTESGSPLLANDMHLGMGIPSIWHQTRLEVPGEIALSGVIFPGVPCMIVGSNEHLSWGVTNLGPDVQDLYLERRHPENPHLFELNGVWQEAEVLREEFHVKGGDSFIEEIYITHNGPVIFDHDEPLSLRWTAHDYTQEIEAILYLSKAKDWEEFKEALNYFHAPAQNFVMADQEGNIGYRANGKIPIRAKGEGLIPAPGWDKDYQWQGYIPFEELPSLYNPIEGFISTANNRAVSSDYPYHISHEWAPPYRAASIRESLVNAKGLTAQDMKDLQYSTANLQAALLLPLLKEDLFSASWEEREAEALEILYSWGESPNDGLDKAGPAIYHTFYLKALEETFLERMGEGLYQEFLQINIVNIFDRMLQEGSLWFEEGEGRGAILQKAFQRAVQVLTERLGEELGEWKWGDLHQIHLTHYLSEAPVLGGYINDGPYPMGGSHLTVALAGYTFLDPFKVNFSAPWRYIVDLGQGHSWENLAGGSIGHPMSPHYRDQTAMWLKGEYTRVYSRGEDLEESRLLRLVPQ